MPNDSVPFDPSMGETLGEHHRLAFPDAAELVAECERKHGPHDAGYRVARVPETQVYVLYGISEADHRVTIACIRTYRGPTN